MVHSNEMGGVVGARSIVGLVLLASIALLVLLIVFVYLRSEQQLSATISPQPATVNVPTDIAAVQHGQHLAGAIALCTSCHGANLGGGVILDDAVARVVAPDITPGGAVAGFSDADYVRAIRNGVGRDGKSLWLMPTDQYARFGDADLGALIAYLKLLPPLTNKLPPNEIRPLGRVQLAFGRSTLLAPVNRAPSAPAPSPDTSPEYGEYLAAIAGCAQCHGPGLSGGPIPGAPRGAAVATNLTSTGLGNWTEADFVRLMRTGHRPDGSAIDPSMPWPYYAQMSDLELRAIWEFLRVVPARATGTR
jgi:cytochrome c553